MTAQGATTGRWVWHDLMSTDTEASKRFYGELFNWKIESVDMGPMGTYLMIKANGKGIGGIVPFDKSHGAPSHWVGYVSVDNVDAAVSRATELGGKVCVPAMDIPNVGRFALVEDPAGAIFSPFKEAGNDGGTGLHGIEPGQFCWEELMTTDTVRASSFYTRLIGWQAETMDMGPMGPYTLYKADGKQECGMMQIDADMKAAGARPYWTPYVVVEDVDASASRATRLGAILHAPPMDIPNVGRFSLVQDPTGAIFALFKGTESLASQAK